ncbi:unnamed protein product [Hymenolepis diminuta]|uniref:ENTH domain-containing protein n=1 Tax=Hymenolepis diminuta TaxID=6216 RepID=A0A0R3SBX7_HYMDI|nr:unnamed protein product [Hymenolepis diminuta]
MPLRRKIKNSVGRYSRAELLVREATSNDPALPGQELLLQIADMTKLPSLYTDTINMIFKRLNDKCKNWRHIYKALVVIDACLRYGSLSFVKECRSQLPQILTLCDFVYSYDQNSNAGFLIREKSQRVAALLKDEYLLKQERQAARIENPRRYSLYDSSRKNSDEKTGRSRSVYNPSDECVVGNNEDERQQISLSMPFGLQESSRKSSDKLKTNDKPTLLESSKKAANARADDLLFFDDPPLKTGRFNTWLESRSKRFSSISTSDPYTPSSSLIGKYNPIFK